jgi:hypothetical protein
LFSLLLTVCIYVGISHWQKTVTNAICVATAACTQTVAYVLFSSVIIYIYTYIYLPDGVLVEVETCDVYVTEHKKFWNYLII